MRSAKFWVAFVMALVAFLRAYTGIDLGVDEATANLIIGGLTAALVWLIPNGRAKK